MACLPANSETTKKLVAERLALGDGRETTVLDLLGVKLKGVVGELEALLDERSKLADAATLLTQDLLGVGSTDDDLRRGRVVYWTIDQCSGGYSLRYERGSHGHRNQSNPPQRAHG